MTHAVSAARYASVEGSTRQLVGDLAVLRAVLDDRLPPHMVLVSLVEMDELR